MTFSNYEDYVKTAEKRLGNVVEAVLKRGYDDVEEDIDDYSIMLMQLEFKKLVTYQLYEVYFPPKRHEFELQLLTDIVETVSHSRSALFIGTAALSGIVGSIASDLCKRLVAHVSMKFEKDKNRLRPFREIETNLQSVQEYFETRKQARIEDISKSLNTDREKLEPLLKLLGFKCKRRKKQQVWINPSVK